MARPLRFSRFQRRLLLALGVTLALSSTLPRVERSALAAQRVTLAVFVEKDAKVQNLKLSELRRIFTRADEGVSGQRIVPFNHTARSSDRVGFDQIVLRMDPDEVSRFWIDRKIRGLPGPPRAVDSLSQLLRLVSHFSGGMGYARANQVTNDVRVIRIDGKLPSEAGYPLQYDE